MYQVHQYFKEVYQYLPEEVYQYSKQVYRYFKKVRSISIFIGSIFVRFGGRYCLVCYQKGSMRLIK